MRVLQINKFFFQFGGVERYMFELSKLLSSNGNDVSYFSMQHPRNADSDYERFFVSNISYRDTSLVYKARTIGKTISKTVYSWESRRKLRSLLAEERPDVAHVHLISHQISPSVLDELSSFGVPVVQTLHEYKLVCPSYHLYLHDTGEVCERCMGGGYYHAVLQRCVQGGIAPSILAAASQYLHRASRIYERNVDLFIAPSRFLADKVVQGGLPADQIRVLGIYIDVASYEPSFTPGDYCVYFGRISPEKGLSTLLKAAARLPRRRLVVVGEGPFRGELQGQAVRQGISNVHFAGYQDGAALKDLVGRAAFVVVPSEWFENSPVVIYEAGALGKPVVASRIGGIPEIVEDGSTGLLFEPGNVDELTDRIEALSADPATCAGMGRRARTRVENVAASHYGSLLAIYREARSRRASSKTERPAPETG